MTPESTKKGARLASKLMDTEFFVVKFSGVNDNYKSFNFFNRLMLLCWRNWMSANYEFWLSGIRNSTRTCVVRVGLRTSTTVTHFEGNKRCLFIFHTGMYWSKHVAGWSQVASTFLNRLAIFKVRVQTIEVTRLYRTEMNQAANSFLLLSIVKAPNSLLGFWTFSIIRNSK